ncbi:MAG: hypothetical protein R3Y54_03355 [Eubacteriales bacterium]
MKKYLKIGAILLAFVIIGLVLYFANAVVGNPVSKYLVNKNAKVYIEETYSDLDLIVEDAFYDFKRVHTYVISVKREVKRVFDAENMKFKYITFGVFNEEGNFAWNAPYISYDDIEREDLSETLEEYSKKNNRPY